MQAIQKRKKQIIWLQAEENLTNWGMHLIIESKESCGKNALKGVEVLKASKDLCGKQTAEGIVEDAKEGQHMLSKEESKDEHGTKLSHGNSFQLQIKSMGQDFSMMYFFKGNNGEDIYRYRYIKYIGDLFYDKEHKKVENEIIPSWEIFMRIVGECNRETINSISP